MAHSDEDHDDGDGGGQNRVTRQKSVFVWGVHGGGIFFSFGTGVGHAIRLDFLFVWIFFVFCFCVVGSWGCNTAR